MREELEVILNEHNKAAEAFQKARLAISSLRLNARKIAVAQEEIDEQISTAIESMIEANRAAIKLLQSSDK